MFRFAYFSGQKVATKAPMSSGSFTSFPSLCAAQQSAFRSEIAPLAWRVICAVEDKLRKQHENFSCTDFDRPKVCHLPLCTGIALNSMQIVSVRELDVRKWNEKCTKNTSSTTRIIRADLFGSICRSFEQPRNFQQYIYTFSKRIHSRCAPSFIIPFRLFARCLSHGMHSKNGFVFARPW